MNFNAAARLSALTGQRNQVLARAEMLDDLARDICATNPRQAEEYRSQADVLFDQSDALACEIVALRDEHGI